MSEHMKVLYLTTTGDNTIELPTPLDIEGYLCGIIELAGKVVNLKGGSKYTILTTHLYTCVIIIHIIFFYIYFNEKHYILIYYCLLIFLLKFFIIRNVI